MKNRLTSLGIHPSPWELSTNHFSPIQLCAIQYKGNMLGMCVVERDCDMWNLTEHVRLPDIPVNRFIQMDIFISEVICDCCSIVWSWQVTEDDVKLLHCCYCKLLNTISPKCKKWLYVQTSLELPKTFMSATIGKTKLSTSTKI